MHESMFVCIYTHLHTRAHTIRMLIVRICIYAASYKVYYMCCTYIYQMYVCILKRVLMYVSRMIYTLQILALEKVLLPVCCKYSPVT